MAYKSFRKVAEESIHLELDKLIVFIFGREFVIKKKIVVFKSIRMNSELSIFQFLFFVIFLPDITEMRS